MITKHRNSYENIISSFIKIYDKKLPNENNLLFLLNCNLKKDNIQFHQSNSNYSNGQFKLWILWNDDTIKKRNLRKESL